MSVRVDRNAAARNDDVGVATMRLPSSSFVDHLDDPHDDEEKMR